MSIVIFPVVGLSFTVSRAQMKMTAKTSFFNHSPFLQIREIENSIEKNNQTADGVERAAVRPRSPYAEVAGKAE